MLKEDILRELELNRGNAISGQSLADRYKVSRNSVWKAVNSLKKDGYSIVSSTNRGYELADDNDIISKQGISVILEEELRHIPIHVFQSIDSTNSEAKRMLANDDDLAWALIVSEEQLKGRSRHSGGFYSPDHMGIYMSLVNKVACHVSDVNPVARNAGRAVIKAVEEETGVTLMVSADNDIYYRNMKAGGIFTEAMLGLETGITSHVIIGIGINVCTTAFPEELAGRATALTGLDINRNRLIAAITNNFFSQQ